jgi:hypothetical protein
LAGRTQRRTSDAKALGAHVTGWFAVIAGTALLAGCDLVERRGEAVYEACLYDSQYSHSSLACECYVDEVSKSLTRDDWSRYDAMASRGYYADSERLQTMFDGSRYGIFESAARRCGLNLFAPERVIVEGADFGESPVGFDRGYADYPGGPGAGVFDGFPGVPERRWGRRDGFPVEPWSYHIEEDSLFPVCVYGLDRRERCLSREEAARLYNDGARYWLLRGDAELATLDLTRSTRSNDIRVPRRDPNAPPTRRYYEYDTLSARRAMEYWNYSIDWGRPFGAQSALMAQRRLQAHMVQCESSTDGLSLQRISRTGPGVSGDVISLQLRQAALASLGYYSADVDGHYGPATRDAVRGFQRELGYDETGTLTPRQTTLLICHAAQTARDPHLQNALGIMYATGLGVARNADLSLEWFETAARRNDADAYFNLAIVFGTGAVLGSYRLCGIVENPERADAYLRDAASLGHPVALRWRSHPEFRRQPSAEARWILISNRLEQAAAESDSDFYLDWRSQIDVDRFDRASLSCLDPETGVTHAQY